MKAASLIALASALGAGFAASNVSGFGTEFALTLTPRDGEAFGYAPTPQHRRGPRNKPGNNLTAARNKAKTRRKAQQKARRK